MGGNWHPPRRHRLLSNTVWCPCPGYYGKWLSLGPIKLLSLIIWSKLQLHSGGSWEGTFAPQVVAIYADIGLDPESEKAVEFSVHFDPVYSTACIEEIRCARCNKYEWNRRDCSPFVTENLAITSKVSSRFTSCDNNISPTLTLRKRSSKKTPRGLMKQS